MKQETNNEMDLLLRQLGRRQDVFAPHAGDHLDADELSAYAENVLPAKARARYTEHIAECSRCRQLVVQLSASAGVVIAQEAVRVSGPSGWRKFLASLFSPMVLKYAGPALGLIVVAVIGVVVLRRDRPREYVSQVKNDQARPAGVAEPVETTQNEQLNDSVPKSAESTTANKEVPAKSLPQQPATTTPAGTPAPAEQNAPAAKAPEPIKESQPVVTAEPPPPSAAKLDTLSEEKRQKNEDAGRKQEAEVKVAAADDSRANFEVNKAKKGEASATARARVAQSKPAVGDLAAAQGAAAPGSARRESVDRDEKDSAETRSVGGKRFRREGGIWIDTAYDQSRGTTNFSRGTEAYRSLIADEPGIKTIADQLDGEFIVVWKGRPYRIH